MKSLTKHMKVDLQLPSFERASEWLNGQTTARQTKGIQHLFTFGPSVRKLQRPTAQVAELRDQRKREGLRVIAVHVPQSGCGEESASVRDAIARLNVTEPCALDNDYKVSQGHEDLPAYFLFDPEARSAALQPGQMVWRASKTNWTRCSPSCEQVVLSARRASCF